MNRLDKIKEYSKILAKASRWHNSKEAILHAETNQSVKKHDEYIYEFYCALRIINSLSKHYDIKITNNKIKNKFPKAPANKTNFPFFMVYEKGTKNLLFQICLGTNIIGVAKETSAPDISFQTPLAPLNPKYSDIIMIFDAKYKHKNNSNIADTEFAKVAYMVRNLQCEKNKTTLPINLYDLEDIKGNSLITNGYPFKTNVNHHILFYINEVAKFDIGETHIVIAY
ncbi:MAG: hypothetical protein C0448_12230 [Sphingobacteriaceae bacterium]|nr:hypothetical protein [Sphingobacteriaceae bacterium]